MVKTKYGNSPKYKTVRQKNGCSRFLIFLKRSQAEKKQKRDRFKDNSLNQITCDSPSNDIFVSCSGQEKIDKLVSCQNLDNCDFVMF